jgi:hypothetical protein
VLWRLILGAKGAETCNSVPLKATGVICINSLTGIVIPKLLQDAGFSMSRSDGVQGMK